MNHTKGRQLLSVLTANTDTIVPYSAMSGALASKQGFCPTDLYISAQSDKKPYFGAHGDEETPVPIPNTEVKLVSGDGIAGLSLWESSTTPAPFLARSGN